MSDIRQEERGAALVMALLLVVVLGTLSTSMSQGVQLLSHDSVDERAAMQALHAAEGGIAQARWRLRQDPEWAGEVLQIGRAQVAILATAIPGEVAHWQVQASAQCHGRGDQGLPSQRIVTVELVGGDGLPRICGWREGL